MNIYDLSVHELQALLGWLNLQRLWVTSSSVERWRSDQLPALRRAAAARFPIESRELHRPTGVRPELAAGYSAETQLSPAEALQAVGRTLGELAGPQRVRSLLDEPTKREWRPADVGGGCARGIEDEPVQGACMTPTHCGERGRCDCWKP